MPNPTLTRRSFAGLLAASTAMSALPAAAQRLARGDAALQLLAQPGHHLILRHALAPGSGDPSNFALGACGTQRNLSEAGREQARRIGAGLRDAALSFAILSSQWCRCLETAQLMGLGPVSDFAVLNSTWRGGSDRQGAQAAALRDRIAAAPAGDRLLMVTHASNIRSLTGLSVSSGEGLVLRSAPSGLAVAGRLEIA